MDNAVSIGAPLTQAVAAGTSARENPLRNNGMWGGKIGGRNPFDTSPPLGPRVPLFNNPLRFYRAALWRALAWERKEGRKRCVTSMFVKVLWLAFWQQRYRQQRIALPHVMPVL